MLRFHIEQGNALKLEIYIKNGEHMSEVWYRLMEEHKRYPYEILKVEPCGSGEHTLAVFVSFDAAEKVKGFLPGIGCSIGTECPVATVRPVLVDTSMDVTVLPTGVGLERNNIEYV